MSQHIDPAPLIADFGGVGKWPEGEAITVNIDPDAEPDVVADITDIESLEKALAQYTQGFSSIWCIHTIEHLKPSTVVPTIASWCKFIAPGGFLMLVVPDGMQILMDYEKGLISYDVLMGLMYVDTPNRPQTSGYEHRWTFRTDVLLKMMKRGGYKNVRRETVGWYKQEWEFDYPDLVAEAPGYMVQNIVAVGEVP